ncbi:putative cue domain protein [Lasiodiplodia theobromae]|uniref:Activating signal cointegrator 1 complex subunit 2 n=1 Tax=Lasiodiplodia theobromae TaxID=45133 RepID=A0A5N5DEQ8_9PEZI|nr:Activating signal cointegrator 1 complex subunit 2 [Lasiodiplodia theobromae]KAF9638278.1 putative cue domain protein [Lasiodiplodia theobromae]
MTLPPLAPFPPASLRQGIVPDEWTAFLDAWTALSLAYLNLPPPAFSSAASDEGSLVNFLASYFYEAARSGNSDSYFQSEKALSLRKQCFLLSHRLLSADQVSSKLLQWNFLADLSHVFVRSERLKELLESLWKRHGDKVEPGLQKLKASLTKTLDSNQPDAAEEPLRSLVPLLHTSPDIATFFVAGSDFLDSLCSAYSKASQSFRPKIVTVASLGILALTKGEKPKFSLLSDTLYSLKSNAESQQKSGQPSLLSDLVTNTPIVTRIKDSGASDEGARVKSLAESLTSFRQSGLARPKKFVRRKVDKGKARATDDEYGHGGFGEVHVHRMSLVTQIQDLFPDLGSGFIVKCLDEYDDDIEQVTAHLLDDSLPPHLKGADRTAQLPAPSQQKPVDFAPHLPPRSTPPPIRRNIYDNDELDQLTVDASRLHIGRRNESLTADNILSDKTFAPNKAAILSALATFDLDDDERDDTYDVEDVGGTIDSTVPGNDEAAELRDDRTEEALFRAYSMSKDAFGRDLATRRSSARQALRSETGMTDEAIEGWAIMLARDPRKLRRLEAKFATFDGRQTELTSTRWTDSPAESGTDTDGGGRGGRGGGRGGAGRGRGGRGRGRGRGGGNAGAGGTAAGPADDKATQVARQRKEANKSSRANHNRREGRARKMARAGFPG